MSTETTTVRVRHLGGDRLSIRVRGHQLFADQPVEDGGEDTAPSPTELFVASLGACVAFYAERFLRRHKPSAEALTVTCDFGWASHPHRVGAIEVTVTAPEMSPALREAFIRVIEQCPIHNTLRQPPAVSFRVATAEPIGAGADG